MSHALLLILCTCVAAQDGALRLTDLIDAGNLTEAKDRAKIAQEPFFENITSYSGFFTVSAEQDNNLFFWFFPAEEDSATKPLVVWQQGGPGQSGLIGVLEEIGPYRLSNGSLVYNPYTWTSDLSVLFFDSPVGTGFSWGQGYSSDVQQMCDDLYTALGQFFTLFPELQSVPVYLSGESYGGKVQIALLEKINSSNTNSFNIQGMFLVSAIFDPSHQVLVTPFLYELGLINQRHYNESQELDQVYLSAIRENNFVQADREWMRITRRHMTATKYSGFSNALDPIDAIKGEVSEPLIISSEVCEALHVGNSSYNGIRDFRVRRTMKPDIMKSVRPALEQLLDSYKVLFIQGMFDLLVPPALNAKLFHNLTFSAQTDYREAQPTKIMVDGIIAGYRKVGGNLQTAVIRNAGHYVSIDQPRWCKEVVKNFLNI